MNRFKKSTVEFEMVNINSSSRLFASKDLIAAVVTFFVITSWSIISTSSDNYLIYGESRTLENAIQEYGYSDRVVTLDFANALHSGEWREYIWILKTWPPGLVAVEYLLLGLANDNVLVLQWMFAGILFLSMALIQYHLTKLLRLDPVRFSISYLIFLCSPFFFDSIIRGNMLMSDALASAFGVLGLILLARFNIELRWLLAGFGALCLTCSIYLRLSWHSLVQILFLFSIAIFFYKLLRGKLDRNRVTEKTLASNLRFPLIFGAILLSTIPYRLVAVDLGLGFGEFGQYPAQTLAAQWASPERVDSTWTKYAGVNIACQMDNTECSYINSNWDSISNNVKAELAIKQILGDPIKFLKIKTPYVVRGLSADPRKFVPEEKWRLSTYFLINLAFLISLFSVVYKYKDSLNIQKTQLAALILIGLFDFFLVYVHHVEVRYLLNFRLSGALCICLLLSKKKEIAE